MLAINERYINSHVKTLDSVYTLGCLWAGQKRKTRAVMTYSQLGKMPLVKLSKSSPPHSSVMHQSLQRDQPHFNSKKNKNTLDGG